MGSGLELLTVSQPHTWLDYQELQEHAQFLLDKNQEVQQKPLTGKWRSDKPTPRTLGSWEAISVPCKSFYHGKSAGNTQFSLEQLRFFVGFRMSRLFGSSLVSGLHVMLILMQKICVRVGFAKKKLGLHSHVRRSFSTFTLR